MGQNLSRRTVDYRRSPIGDFGDSLKTIRLLLLVVIAAVTTAGTVAILCYPLSFLMEAELLTFISRPLLITAPFLGAVVGGLIAFDFSKLTQRPKSSTLVAFETTPGIHQTESLAFHD